MRRIPQFLLNAIAVVSLGWFGCVKSGQLAGGTSETTNGEIIAQVTRNDGRPAARIKAYVVDDQDWMAKVAEGRSVVLDSSNTDSSGSFRVNVHDFARCNLQLDGGDEGLFLGDFGADSAVTGKLKLAIEPTGSVSGKVYPDTVVILSLKLRGTTYSSLIGSDSIYAFPSVAPGTFTLVAVVRRNNGVSVDSLRTVTVARGQKITGLDLDFRSKKIPDTTRPPDTVKAAYSGAIRSSIGTPTPGARVWLMDGNGWAVKTAGGRSVALDSAVTDAKGYFNLTLRNCARCNLVVESGREALVEWGYLIKAPSSAPETLTTMPVGSISGRVYPEGADIVGLNLAGTAYSAVIHADSTYAFPAVAPGTYSLFARVRRNGGVFADSIKTLIVAAGQAISGFDLDFGPNRVLVVNFDSGYWFGSAFTRKVAGSWIQSTYASSTRGRNALPGGLTAYSGLSLVTDFVFRKGQAVPNAIMGFQMDAPVDLSLMKSFSFVITGTGRVYVRFHSRGLSALTNDSVQFEHPVDLRPGWTKVEIAVDSLALTRNAPAPLRGYSWRNAAKEINRVEIVALPLDPSPADSTTLRFGLDDIYFEGIYPRQITLVDTTLSR